MSTVQEILSTPGLPAIVVHGGAWVRPGAVTQPILDGLARAAAEGLRVMQGGGSAIDAAEAATVVLEEDSNFNAGRGSCLTSDGTIEMDASIMSGEGLAAGAVANVTGVRNPIRLARSVMDDGAHVMLAGEGALVFARERGIELVEPDWHVTAIQQARYEELRAQARAGAAARGKLGTVGAVAVDRHGRIAAATSTGGTVFKRPGRIGDSPLIGAGTYAESGVGGVSCTGHGESIIRLVLAKAACDAMRNGASPWEAARACSDVLRDRVAGAGGLITMGPDGRAGWAMNTSHMSRAFFRDGLDAPLAVV